jgi:phosphinothricin acetyltransferase
VSTTQRTIPPVRLAGPDDIEAILGIANWAAAHTAANFAVEPERLEDWRESWRSTHEMFPWVVATGDDGRVVGFAKSGPHKGRCAYHWTAEVSVYVDPDHHGGGVGTAAYGRLFDLLRRQGYWTLLAGITMPNPASVRLHERYGFIRAGTFERVGWKFGRWHDVSYWTRRLVDDDGPPGALRTVREVLGASGGET